MSSGLKVLSAKDDAAGVAISAKTKVSLSGLNIANNNLQMSIAMFNTAESALDNAESILLELRRMSLKAVDSSCGEDVRKVFQDKSDILTEELERIQQGTKFNNLNLFNSKADTAKKQTPSNTQENNEPEQNAPQNAPQANIAPLSSPNRNLNANLLTAPSSLNLQNDESGEINGENDNNVSLNNTTLSSPKLMAGGIRLLGASPEDTPRIAENESNDGVYITGAFDFAKNEEYKVNIDGAVYTIKNRNSTDATISYKKEIETGIITFTCNTFTITGEKDANHNIVINGKNNWVYGGDLINEFHPFSNTSTGNRFYGGATDETFNITGYNNSYYGLGGNDTFNIDTGASTYNYLYGGEGNDIFNHNINGHQYYYGEAGEDTFNVNANSGTYNGGLANDTFDIKGNSLTVNGNEGDDKITINGNSCTIYGNAGDDNIKIESGSNNFVDGGAGTNRFVNNGTNTTSTNVPGANSYTIDFAKKEERNIVVETSRGNFTYKVTNRNNSANQMTIKVEEDGLINFLKGGSFTIEGEKNVSHYIKLTQSSNWFYGSDVGDNITSTSGSNRVYTGKGNDNVTISGTSNIVDTGDGDDIITAGSYDGSIFSGNGNDTINYSGYMSYIETGAGDDEIIVKSNPTSSHIDLGSGTDVIRGENANGTVNNNRTISYSLYTGDENDSIQLEGRNIDNSILYSIDGFGNETEFSSFKLDAAETKDLVIHTNNGDVTYNIYNRVAHEKTLKYKYDKVEDKIIFVGHNFTIKGQTDVQHNVEIYGSWTYFYGGNLDDKLTYTTGGGGQLHGGGGNDILSNTTTNGYSTALYGDDGEDTIYVNNSGSVYGGNGDDTIHINVTGINTCDGGEGNDNYYINKTAQSIDNYGNNVYYIDSNDITLSAGAGNDTFYITGSNNNVAGGGGDDYFIVSGKNNTIDGGTGTNYIVNNGEENSTPNTADDPNANSLIFSYIGEQKSFSIDGKLYVVKNSSEMGSGIANNSISYTYNANTGEIILSGSSLTVTASDGVSHNIRIQGNNNIINGGNMADTVIVNSGTNNLIKGNGGNDNITLASENNSVQGGSGNDTITINAATNKTVDGGDGNDTFYINANNNTDIRTGSGNDIVRSTTGTSGNKINLSDGNNDLLLNGNNNTVTAENGNNRISVVGNSNNISAGSGRNTLGVNGNNNTLEAKGNSTFNAQGNDNDFNISGNNNTINSKGEAGSVTSIGNNNIYLNGNNGAVNSIGNSTIKLTGDNASITSIGNGDLTAIGLNSNINSIGNSKINTTGDEALVTAETGTITHNGNSATLTAKGANLNVFGNNNEITNTSQRETSASVELEGNNNVLNSENINDNIKLSGNNNTLSASNYNDSIEITGDNNKLTVSEGTNRIRVRGDNNNVQGGLGTDSFRISSGVDNVFEGGEETQRNTIYNLGENTTFNNCIDITPQPLDVNIQVGSDKEEDITQTIQFLLGDFWIDVSTVESSKESMNRIDELLDHIHQQKSSLGASVNRFEQILKLNQNKIENLNLKKSIIEDCDMAEESVKFALNNIRQDMQISLWSQVGNIRREGIMGLINGALAYKF